MSPEKPCKPCAPDGGHNPFDGLPRHWVPLGSAPGVVLGRWWDLAAGPTSSDRWFFCLDCQHAWQVHCEERQNDGYPSLTSFPRATLRILAVDDLDALVTTLQDARRSTGDSFFVEAFFRCAPIPLQRAAVEVVELAGAGLGFSVVYWFDIILTRLAEPTVRRAHREMCDQATRIAEQLEQLDTEQIDQWLANLDENLPATAIQEPVETVRLQTIAPVLELLERRIAELPADEHHWNASHLATLVRRLVWQSFDAHGRIVIVPAEEELRLRQLAQELDALEAREAGSRR